jgi:hypothetical protein
VLNWRQLLHNPVFINRVEVNGLSLTMPPKQVRASLPPIAGQSGPGVDKSSAGIRILVGAILIGHASLVLENGNPGKPPRDFEIHQLQLSSVSPGHAMKFHATLVNPKPLGDIDSTGDFGPFNADSPGDTPVSGTYSFSHADLSTLKGIAGILASTGSYSGQLDRIDVTGQTTTPDFRLTIANHPLPLTTTFHAIVDGTNGDTWLQPVDAWLAKTHILAQGKVVRSAGVPGRHIQLQVTVGPGRIQDLLQLSVKTDPPLLNGQVRTHMNFDLPPGPQSVTDKLHLDGSFAIDNVHFANDRFQHDVDQLSLRGLGKAGAANQEQAAMKAGNTDGGIAADIASAMRGTFLFGDGRLTVSSLDFQVPGAQIALTGVYSLDGELFDFHGTARLDAHVSQMVTGWRSVLLKTVDPLFAKNGAGTQVPIHITGTRSDPRIGLDFHHKDQQ